MNLGSNSSVSFKNRYIILLLYVWSKLQQFCTVWASLNFHVTELMLGGASLTVSSAHVICKGLTSFGFDTYWSSYIRNMTYKKRWSHILLHHWNLQSKGTRYIFLTLRALSISTLVKTWCGNPLQGEASAPREM